MEGIAHYFKFDLANVQFLYFYIYLGIAALFSFFLVFRSESRYKTTLFFLCFYLLTGNLNDILTIRIPGFSFFEIQPVRFIYLFLLGLMLSKVFFSKNRSLLTWPEKMPWFEIFLYIYVLFLTLSVIVNVFPKDLKTITDALAFLIIIIAIRMMGDKPSYALIGKSMIIGAVVSSFVGFYQLSVDPYFLKIGDYRPAFGEFIRPNGIFNAEYLHSYYLIIALTWTLITVKNRTAKIALVSLFILGVLSSFMRMSWIILILLLTIYVLFIRKVSLGKVLTAGLAGLSVLLVVSVMFYQDIMNSTLVRERLADSIDGRKGYYGMVFDNIGDKPLFGYGSLENEVYYVNLLRITMSRERASAADGSIHSGYFSSLFEYGIPAFVCFCLFVILAVAYYLSRIGKDPFYLVPFFVSIIYMIGNFTNTFLFLHYLSFLYALHIGMGMGIDKVEEQERSALKGNMLRPYAKLKP